MNITAQDLQVKVRRTDPNVANWVPLRGENGDLELIVLIDNGLRHSIGTQLPEISSFIKDLPDNVKVGVAYMENGRAAMAGPLSADHAQVAHGFVCPSGFPDQAAALTSASLTWRSTGHRTTTRRGTKSL